MTKIAVPSTDSADSVLAHQHRRVKIVHQVPARLGLLGYGLRQDCCMTLGRNLQFKSA